MEQLNNVLDRTRQRVELLDPIDQRKRIEHFMFDVVDYERASRQYALVPLAVNGDQGLNVPYRISKLALRQLCERIRMPAKMLGRLEELNQIKLLAICMNTLMQHSGGSLAMLRTVAGAGGDTRLLRAVLGSQYAPLDDLELLEVAAPHLEGAEIAFAAFGETGTHITAVWTNGTMRDGLLKGVHIANSEVGLRAVSIEAVVYRPACTNILPALGLGGMGEGEQAYTGGRSYYRSKGRAFRGEATSGWRFIHRGDTGRLGVFVADAIADVSRQYEGTLARWRQGLHDMIADPIGAIEDIAQNRQLTVDQYKAALNAWSETRPDFGPCRTGIANAFTLAAQNEVHPDDRYAMQAAGTYALGAYTPQR